MAMVGAAGKALTTICKSCQPDREAGWDSPGATIHFMAASVIHDTNARWLVSWDSVPAWLVDRDAAGSPVMERGFLSLAGRG